MLKKPLFSLIVITLSLASVQSTVAAKGGGVSGQAGGRSMSHMSERGMANSNAQHRAGSTRGLERAQLRMNEQGKKHQKAKQQKAPEDDKD